MAKSSKIEKEAALDEDFTPTFSKTIQDINKINAEPEEEPKVLKVVKKPIKASRQKNVPKNITTTSVKKIKNNNSLKQGISFVINPELIIEFEELYNRFRKKTQAYFTYSSKAQLFEVGCIFLEKQYKSKRKFKKAPEKFIAFITRKGKRTAGNQHELRKGSGKAMFISIEADIVQTYYDIIYTFMNQKGDIGNESYSTSYFFYDFLTLLNENFDDFCKYETDNPKD